MAAVDSFSPVRVFEIGFDLDQYQCLLVDGDDAFSAPFFSTMRFEGGFVADQWVPPPIYSDQPRLKAPDVFHLVGAVGLVLTDRALSDLEDLVLASGELLPLRRDGDDLHLLNVTGVYNCVDVEHSIPDGAAYSGLAFYPHRLPENPLFRIPENHSSEIFCVERPESSLGFKARFERAGLTGLIFRERWNEQDGAIPEDTGW